MRTILSRKMLRSFMPICAAILTAQFLSGCVQLLLLAAHENDRSHRVTTFSPDGRKLAIQWPFHFVIYDIERRKSFELALSGLNASSPSFSPDGNRLAVITSCSDKCPDGAVSSRATIFDLRANRIERDIVLPFR